VKCLIIAAGQGSRLRQNAECKPLAPILGISLIERVMHAALKGGVTEFVVVSGYQGERLRNHLDQIAVRDNLAVQHVVNDQWREPNGISVLKAASVLHEPFLLLMSDHLFDPTIVSDLLRREMPQQGLTLAVDCRLQNPFVDLADVTRVLHDGERIHAIGKNIGEYNGFDTGIFRCSPGLFTALEASVTDGDASLSGGVRTLAEQGLAHIYDIGDRFWLDIDDSRALVKAEVTLIENIERDAISIAPSYPAAVSHN